MMSHTDSLGHYHLLEAIDNHTMLSHHVHTLVHVEPS